MDLSRFRRLHRLVWAALLATACLWGVDRALTATVCDRLTTESTLVDARFLARDLFRSFQPRPGLAAVITSPLFKSFSGSCHVQFAEDRQLAVRVLDSRNQAF